MGANKAVIDWELVDKMLTQFCDGTEVAAALGIHPETFYDRIKEEFKIGFTEYRQRKRSLGATQLRNLQLRSAMGWTAKEDKKYRPPSDTMLIWLGKQYLEQKERREYVQKIEDCKAPYFEDPLKEASSFEDLL